MLIHRRILPKDRVFCFRKSQLNYSVLGKGKPVILLHGSMTADSWGGFEKELAKYCTVYLPHLPGFGASDSVGNGLHNSELFASAFSSFIKHEKLEIAPIIALSLGSVIASKSMVRDSFNNTLVLVGVPVGVQSSKLKNASLIPVWIRRIMVSTVWGRKKILVPVLRDIIGKADKESDDRLLDDIKSTDVKSLVDIDVYHEIELQMPKLLKQLKNEVYYIYGTKDKLLKTSKHLITKPILIKGADHNIFTSQPKKTLDVIRNVLHL